VKELHTLRGKVGGRIKIFLLYLLHICNVKIIVSSCYVRAVVQGWVNVMMMMLVVDGNTECHKTRVFAEIVEKRENCISFSRNENESRILEKMRSFTTQVKIFSFPLVRFCSKFLNVIKLCCFFNFSFYYCTA
jgi:hypothetical protein